MRILHTSDWHVGKTMRGRSRLEEHQAVLDELVGIADAREVDLVVVAGDLFETAAPTPEAENLVYSTLLRLGQTGAAVVALSGNHDNPYRLQAVAPLFALAGVVVQPHAAAPADGGVLELTTKGGDARVALLPFVSQRGIIKAHDLMEGEAADHNLKYADRLTRIISVLCGDFEADAVNVLASHCMCLGGLAGGGERAQTFIDYAIPHTAFLPSTHYVALGHLHRSQRIAGACPIHYCGSPLQLDFGETQNDPQILLIEAEPKKPARVEPVLLASGRRLQTVKGTLDQLRALGDAVGDDYLRVFVDERQRSGLADEVRGFLPHAVDVIIGPQDASASAKARSHDKRTPEELFTAYLDENSVDATAMVPLFNELYEAVHAPA